MAVVIDRTSCQGVYTCPEGGLCIEICAMNAMDNDNGIPKVSDDLCNNCGLCVLNCPNKAISK